MLDLDKHGNIFLVANVLVDPSEFFSQNTHAGCIYLFSFFSAFVPTCKLYIGLEMYIWPNYK
jgi:hypothetical protein